MDTLTAVAASGLRARMEALDLLANNIANAGTAGFKADRESYNLYLAPAALDGAAYPAPATSPVVERNWTDFSQGTLADTNGQLDVAISGKGFFAVQGPSGALYTRNGAFQLAKDGRLVTAEGYPVRATGGGTIQVDPRKSVEIAKDGSVRQDGADVGQVAVFELTAGIAKSGQNYLRAETARPLTPADYSLHQGKLEASNASPAESAVRLVAIMRQFETLQKAVAIGADMNRRAIEEIGRVTS